MAGSSRNRKSLRSRKLAALASGALFVVGTSLTGASRTFAQGASAQPAQGASGSAATVNMSDLPRTNGAEALPSDVPRPRNGLSDADYDSLKAAAAEHGKGAPGSTGPAPAGSQSGSQTPVPH